MHFCTSSIAGDLAGGLSVIRRLPSKSQFNVPPSHVALPVSRAALCLLCFRLHDAGARQTQETRSRGPRRHSGATGGAVPSTAETAIQARFAASREAPGAWFLPENL